MQWDFNDLRRRVAARLADGPLAEDDAEQGAVYEYFLKIVNAMTVDERATPISCSIARRASVSRTMPVCHWRKLMHSSRSDRYGQLSPQSFQTRIDPLSAAATIARRSWYGSP